MKVQTLSVVIGSTACNAKCPFCISKMTPTCSKTHSINFRNLEKSCRLAVQCGASAVLITGKGEPTLDRDSLLATCISVNPYFPIIELQTNGYALNYQIAKELYDSGLTTVALSLVHYNDEKNNEIYQHPKPLEIKKLISLLHEVGISVRLTCMMLKGFIDSIDETEILLNFCKRNNVEQLTIRPIDVPPISKNRKISDWAARNTVICDTFKMICDHYRANSKLLLNLAHGAEVYDYNGQNLCLGTCLTRDPNPENMRQLIFFPDGHLRYDWVYNGAILI